MFKFTNALENIRIASPCAQDWDEMVGDERQRFCGACKLNVYNLSGMSRSEAENLIFQSEDGRLCVRFYRRADGTVLTKDCPVGWQAIKQNVSKAATAFASIFFTACGAIGLTNYFGKSSERKATTETILPHIESLPTQNPQIELPMMGAMPIKIAPNTKEKQIETMGKVAVRKNGQISVGRIERIKPVEAGP